MLDQPAKLLRRQHRGSVVHRAVQGADAILVRESPVDAEAVARMPGCRVVVRSRPGRGTAVILYLPLVENEEEFEE